MDIRGAFDYADRNTMVKVMKEMELPKAVLKWTYWWVCYGKQSQAPDGREDWSKKSNSDWNSLGITYFIAFISSIHNTDIRRDQKLRGIPLRFIDNVTITVSGDGD